MSEYQARVRQDATGIHIEEVRPIPVSPIGLTLELANAFVDGWNMCLGHSYLAATARVREENDDGRE